MKPIYLIISLCVLVVIGGIITYVVMNKKSEPEQSGGSSVGDALMGVTSGIFGKIKDSSNSHKSKKLAKEQNKLENNRHARKIKKLSEKKHLRKHGEKKLKKHESKQGKHAALVSSLTDTMGISHSNDNSEE